MDNLGDSAGASFGAVFGFLNQASCRGWPSDCHVVFIGLLDDLTHRHRDGDLLLATADHHGRHFHSAVIRGHSSSDNFSARHNSLQLSARDVAVYSSVRFRVSGTKTDYSLVTRLVLGT